MRRLGTYLVHLVLLVASLEVACRLGFALPYFADRRIFHDELSWRRAWVRLRGPGPEIRYGQDVYDTTKGWKSRPNMGPVRRADGAVLSTNSHGLRGSTEHPYERRSGLPRLLLVGDSFTFGEGVSDAETYASQLQRWLPGVDIVNMGMRGYGHDQMLILLREEGVKYAPDVVLLGFVGRDMSRNLLAFRDYAKPRFVLRRGALALTASPVPPPEMLLQWDWVRPRLYDMASLVGQVVSEQTGLQAREEAAVTAAILAEIARVAERIRAVPVVAYLPVGPELSGAPGTLAGERFLSQFCESHREVRCFSTGPRFTEALESGVRFSAQGHWDAAAHRVAAEAIGSYLVREHLLGAS